jgi:hypothetical protein
MTRLMAANEAPPEALRGLTSSHRHAASRRRRPWPHHRIHLPYRHASLRSDPARLRPHAGVLAQIRRYELSVCFNSSQ